MTFHDGASNMLATSSIFELSFLESLASYDMMSKSATAPANGRRSKHHNPWALEEAEALVEVGPARNSPPRHRNPPCLQTLDS